MLLELSGYEEEEKTINSKHSIVSKKSPIFIRKNITPQ